MKKLVVVLSVLLVLSLSLAAQEEGSSFAIDAGAGLSMGFFDTSAAGDYADVAGIFATLLSLRGGVFGDFRYLLTPDMSVGAELGFYSMSVSGSINAFFLDMPVRALFRYGGGSTFIQGFAGYYLAITGSTLSGLEVGAKASLGGAYLAGSYIIGSVNYLRIELGYALNNIATF